MSISGNIRKGYFLAFHESNHSLLSVKVLYEHYYNRDKKQRQEEKVTGNVTGYVQLS